MVEVAPNVKIEVKENKMVVTVDMSKDQGPSKSGKTRVIASSHGNVPVPGHADCRLGLNVYRKPNGE